MENVTIEPGLNYINWAALSGTKLKEREIKLVKIRLQTVSNAISASIQQFTTENLQRFQLIEPQVHIQINRMQTENSVAFFNAIDKIKLNTFNKSITQQLAIWKGYKSKTKEINTFQDYFKKSRGWWDLRKVDIIAKHILIPISDMINQFVQQAAKKFFANHFFRLQKLYTIYLYTLILINLVKITMKLPNTRKLFVFPAQCYAMVQLTNSETYGCNYKQLSLAIKKQYNKVSKNKNIRNDILKTLTKQYNISKLTFQSELLRLHGEVDNYKSPQIIQSTLSTYTYNSNYVGSPDIIFDKNNYQHHHSSDYKSKAFRYHPFDVCGCCVARH